MIHNLCIPAKLPLTLIQFRSHFLQLNKNSLSNLFRRHPSRRRTLRSLAPTRKISQLHHQRSRKSIFQCSPRGKRSALFQASLQTAASMFVGKKKMFQYLIRAPRFRSSLRHHTSVRDSHCFFEFPSQEFEIGIHSVTSVQCSVTTLLRQHILFLAIIFFILSSCAKRRTYAFFSRHPNACALLFVQHDKL
jgi:hypothetical protein